MEGVVSGGWDYVWGAYGVTAVALGFFVFQAVMRLRQEERDARRTDQEKR